MRALVALLMLLALGLPAWAVNPSEMLADPALEARARAISSELRCLVCQNQSIEDSDADLAAQLRVLVRERLTAGDTDAEARQFIVDRYGEFVLLRPVLGWHTIVLWATAPALLLIGTLAVLVGVRRRKMLPGSSETAISEEESAALAELAAGEHDA